MTRRVRLAFLREAKPDTLFFPWDLKSGRPVWLYNTRLLNFPRLRTNVRSEIVIVGSGVTGALVAHQLIVAGFRVIMVDKRPVVTGSTSASTALLLYETDFSLAQLGKIHGADVARRTYALGRRAIREIEKLTNALKISCNFKRRKSLYVASDRRGVRFLQKEFALRSRAKFPVEKLDRKELKERFGLNFPGALYSSGAGEVDAVKLATGILAHHVRTGKLRVFAQTKIIKMQAGSEQVVLRTANGKTLTANRVIVATGYESAPFLEEGRVALHSSYVLASHPLPSTHFWEDDCLIWETARPYFYLRTTADRRVLIGGEDEPYADPRRRDAQLAKKRSRLEKRIHELFPHIPFKTEFLWDGTFGESLDGLPYVGPKKDASPRVLYALGYGGNGITFSQIAAKIIADYCCGRKKPRNAELFTFDR